MNSVYLVVLEVENDLGTPAQLLPGRVPSNSERPTGLGLPHVLLVVIVLGGHNHFLGDEVGGVETDTELTNHGHVGPSGEGLHELLGPGPGDCTEVVDEVGLGHADAAVNDRERVARLVRDDMDEQLRLRIELVLVREALEPDLIQRLQKSKKTLNNSDCRLADQKQII
jgi:hypothetical protein